MKHALVVAASLLPGALGAGIASGNALSAPDTVHAEADGTFIYRFTCTAAPDSTMLAGMGWNNGVNVSGELHGDCFCFSNCIVGPGEEVSFDVEGTLEDPMIQGTVDNWVAFCGDPDMHATTTVMPYDPLPALPVTWGRIKARYR